MDQSRRAVLGACVGATAALAGCGSGPDDSTPSADRETERTPAPSAGQSGGGPIEVPAAAESYLESANGYDGTVHDARGQTDVTVTVGAGDGLSFDPAAIRIDPGATVYWEWTGEGGDHKVRSTDTTGGDWDASVTGEPLDSGDPTGTPGVNYEYTFQQRGVYPYNCLVHRGQGMFGVVLAGDV